MVPRFSRYFFGRDKAENNLGRRTVREEAVALVSGKPVTLSSALSKKKMNPAVGASITNQNAGNANINHVAVKVQINDDIRRFTFPELSWDALRKKVSETFKVPEGVLLIKYKDEEGDMITIDCNEVLLEVQRIATQQSTLMRVFASRKSKVVAPPPGLVPIAADSVPTHTDATSIDLDTKQWKEDLRQQKKLLRQEEKERHHQEKDEFKRQRYEAKMHSKARELGVEPFDPSKGTWREQRQAMREQVREERHAERNARRIAGREDSRCGGRRGERTCRNKLVARFVKHVTVPDETNFEPNTDFVKTWRMRNESYDTLADCKLIFVSKQSGDLMGAPEEVSIPSIPPGFEADISVKMTAPAQPGRYVGFWRMANKDGRKFGQRIWVKINVVGPSSSSDEEAAPKITTFAKPEDEIAASFFEIKEEEEQKELEEARQQGHAEPEPARKQTVAELLRSLKDLGFSDVGKNIKLLQKHDNNVNKVVEELLM